MNKYLSSGLREYNTGRCKSLHPESVELESLKD